MKADETPCPLEPPLLLGALTALLAKAKAEGSGSGAVKKTRGRRKA